MRKRIRCLWHQEETPSLVQRKDGWYCYGVCNKLYPHKDVEEKTGVHYEYEEDDNEREDVKERIQYIKSLKRVAIRGLEFPADDRGYFIVWPDQSFYKYRLFSPGKGSKYLGPKGIKPPLFKWIDKGRNTLFLSEGEIDCMSLALAFPEHDHASPGSASMFNADNLSKYLTYFKRYSNIIVVLDDDAAGLKGRIEAKAFFFNKVPFVDYIHVKPDCNEILSEKGPKGLREKLQRENPK